MNVLSTTKIIYILLFRNLYFYKNGKQHLKYDTHFAFYTFYIFYRFIIILNINHLNNYLLSTIVEIMQKLKSFVEGFNKNGFLQNFVEGLQKYCRIYKILIFNIVESVEGVEAIFTPWEKAERVPGTQKKCPYGFTVQAFSTLLLKQYKINSFV